MNETTRKSVKNILTKDGSKIKDMVQLYPEIRDDQELLNLASKSYLKAHNVASENLRSNRIFCEQVVKKDPQFILLVSESLLKDDSFIRSLILDGTCIYDYLSEERRLNKELTLLSLRHAGNGSGKLPKDAMDEGHGTNNIPLKLFDDADVVRQWVLNGGTINNASYRLATDMEFVKEMVLLHSQNFNYAGDKLKHIPEFLKFVVQHCPEKIADIEMYEPCYPALLDIWFSQKKEFPFKEIKSPSPIMLFKDETHLEILESHLKGKSQTYLMDAIKQINDTASKDNEFQVACWIIGHLNLDSLNKTKESLSINKNLAQTIEKVINEEQDKRKLMNIKQINIKQKQTTRKITR